MDYIKEKGIASMQEVYEISNNFLHILYTTPHLEKLASFLVTECGCFRIDLSIPNPKPLAIYPNHHKVSSTTFFVLEETDDNHYTDVERAKEILNDLTQAALNVEREKKKTKIKKDPTLKIDVDSFEKPKSSTKYRENQFRARDCMINGFIPMRPVQLQMMHIFIFDTFGSQPFTIQQFIDNMSLDFMSKIVGIKHMPEVFLKDIRLRFILVSCFPKRIQEQIQLSEAPEVLLQNFKRMSNTGFSRYYRQFLTKIDEDTYRLIDSVKINFLDQFEISYNFTNHDQINEFHYMLEIIDLLENIDPHSFSLWIKRFSIERKPRGEPTIVTRKIMDSYINSPYNKTFPFFFPQVERFISKYGQNWCNMKSSLLEIFQNEDKKAAILMQCMYPSAGPVDDFVNGRSFKPEPFTLFSKITSKDFESLKNDTNQNNNNKDNPSHSNYYDPNLFFNFLSAIMKLFPSGLITKSCSMWEKAMEIFTEVTGVNANVFLRGNTPEALDYVLKSKLPEYKDLCSFSTVNESIKVRQFDQLSLLADHLNYLKRGQSEIEQLKIHQNENYENDNDLDFKIKTIRKQFMLRSEIFELTTSEYIDRFSMKKLRYVLSCRTAEMAERLKILSLTPVDMISFNYAKIFLAEIEDIEPENTADSNLSNEEEESNDHEKDIDYANSTITNGVLFLKLTNFISKRYLQFKRSNQLFMRNGLNCELYTITPSLTFTNINNFFKDLIENPFQFNLRAQINCGSVTFFLDDKIPISLNLEYSGKPSAKRQKRFSRNDEDSDTFGDDDNDDDIILNDDIVIDSSYLLQKLSGAINMKYKSRRPNSLSLIVQKVRRYDSVSVKLNGLLLPLLTNKNINIESNDNDNDSVNRKGRGRRKGRKRMSKEEDDTNIKGEGFGGYGDFKKLNEMRIVDQLQKASELSSNFRNYPSDTSDALYTRFMQLFVVIFQARPRQDSQSFILVCRLLYAFIDHKFASGAPLDAILDEFASFNIAQIFDGLSFLEQFGFVYKLRADSAMPHFLSDEFAESRLMKVNSLTPKMADQIDTQTKTQPKRRPKTKTKTKAKQKKKSSRNKKKYISDDSYSDFDESSDEEIEENEVESDVTNQTEKIDTNSSTFSELIIPHIWINANGFVDSKLMHRIMRKIVEVVEFEPGIEFTDLAGKIPSISPNDLFTLVDALECDEVIYSLFMLNEDPDCDELEKPLFEEVKSIPSPPVDCTMYMYSLAVNMANPLLKPAVRRNIFPTERCKFNLALAIEDTSFE